MLKIHGFGISKFCIYAQVYIILTTTGFYTFNLIKMQILCACIHLNAVALIRCPLLFWFFLHMYMNIPKQLGAEKKSFWIEYRWFCSSTYVALNVHGHGGQLGAVKLSRCGRHVGQHDSAGGKCTFPDRFSGENSSTANWTKPFWKRAKEPFTNVHI